MTKKDAILVFIKTAGTIIIFTTLVDMTALLPFSESDINPLAIYLFYTIIAILMMMGANMIAKKLVPTDKELKISGLKIMPQNVFVIILRIVWMFTIIASVEHLIKIGLGLANIRMGLVIAHLLAIIIGVYFLFGARHIARLVFEWPSGRPAINKYPPTPKRSKL